MRRQIIIAVAISAALVIVGWLVYAAMFSESDPTPDPKEDTSVTDGNSNPEGDTAHKPEDIKNVEVVSVEGRVQRRKPGSETWFELKKGDRLQQDETIQADESGRAVMDFEDQATVEIMPNSDFTVKEMTSTVSRVRVNEGRLSAVVHGKEGSKLLVEAKGSDAVAEAKEGKFSVLADGEGQMAVATETGRVVLSAMGQSEVVEGGMQSVVHPNSPPSKPNSIPKSLFLKVGRPGAKVLRKKETFVKGKTTPGAVVSVNDVRMLVDEDGHFEGTVPLKEGNNRITVAAEHVAGMERERTFTGVMVDTRPPDVESAVEWGAGGGNQ